MLRPLPIPQPLDFPPPDVSLLRSLRRPLSADRPAADFFGTCTTRIPSYCLLPPVVVEYGAACPTPHDDDDVAWGVYTVGGDRGHAREDGSS
jgi:hypothetical protein